jgi:hypothetical protein
LTKVILRLSLSRAHFIKGMQCLTVGLSFENTCNQRPRAWGSRPHQSSSSAWCQRRMNLLHDRTLRLITRRQHRRQSARVSARASVHFFSSSAFPPQLTPARDSPPSRQFSEIAERAQSGRITMPLSGGPTCIQPPMKEEAFDSGSHYPSRPPTTVFKLRMTADTTAWRGL